MFVPLFLMAKLLKFLLYTSIASYLRVFLILTRGRSSNFMGTGREYIKFLSCLYFLIKKILEVPTTHTDCLCPEGLHKLYIGSLVTCANSRSLLKRRQVLWRTFSVMCILVICASSGSLKENWCICCFAIENTELFYFFAGALFVSLFTVLICFFYSVATKEGNKKALPSNIIIYLEEIQDKIYIYIYIYLYFHQWNIALFVF